jgi:alpha-mannosidase
VDASGTVALEHRPTGRLVADAIALIDETDAGDLYTPAPRAREVVVECRGAKCVHRGPLRGELEVRYRMRDPSRRGRVDADVSLHLVLDAGAGFLRVEVEGENHRGDHRLRLALRGDVTTPAVWADAAFGTVRRERVEIGEAEAAVESAPSTAPLHRYVSRFDNEHGFTVFSDGLAEYEARESGELLVTLVRAVGELSKNDLPERPGHAGWPTPTPLAQCLGPFHGSFAVMFHGPRGANTIDEIERASDDVLLPLVGTTLRSAIDPLGEVEGVELTGAGLAFSAMKESEDGEWLVLRCVNLLDIETRGSWHLPYPVREAHLARLDETVMAALETFGAEVPFVAGTHAITTIVVR